tara:strand:- start:4036 stop:4221 length:186 start_codon:yes stop_codon:yes gene_type:complete
MMENQNAKAYSLYLTDLELEKLKKEAKELEKIVKKKVGVSRLIRIKLKLNGDLEELKTGVE